MFNIVWQSFVTERKIRKMVSGYIGSIYYSCIIVQSISKFLLFCDPMDCSKPGIPVLHYPLELALIHGHWVSDAIQLAYPL